MGSHHLYEEDPHQQDIAVAKVLLHEHYDSWTIQNDICMLKLAEEADFSSDYVGAIDLPEDGSPEAGDECTVCGWGTTTEGGSLAKVLMKVQKKVYL